MSAGRVFVVQGCGRDRTERSEASDGDRRGTPDAYAHMIEETARHCGHLDLLREATDGAVGE